MIDLGKRIRELRCSRHFAQKQFTVSRTHISRMELHQQKPSLEMIERLAACFDIGIEVLLGSDERFYASLVFSDEFVMAVKPFLKLLTEEQKKLILRTLEAAPKLPEDRRRKLDPTESLILNEYRQSTGPKDSTTTSPILPIPSLPLVASQRMGRFKRPHL